ncbi:MAG: response regulator transcription factor [Woeseia sp.]
MTESAVSNPSVFVIDDDQSIRHAMELLMRSVGMTCRIFHSAGDFLDVYSPDLSGCLVLDIRMPGISGLELQDKLANLGSSLPIIFITGYGDVPMAVEAMQKGAFDFLEKPFRDQELLERIGAAMEADSMQRAQEHQAQAVQQRVARLTKREREVLELVITGKPNKIIAHELDVSQRTVEIHRARVMEKMEAGSLAELVRMYLAITGRSG